MEKPFGIDIKNNNYSFLEKEKGPFKTSILLDEKIIQTKEIKLEESHSFSFDEPFEYNKSYKFTVETELNKAELNFETTLKLESKFIKPKNKEIFSPIFIKEF